MDNEQIVALLVAHRFWKKAQLDGMDQLTAQSLAQDIVKTNRQAIEAGNVPEMTILSILDTFYQSLSLSIQSAGPDVDVNQLDCEQFERNLTGHIEKQRNRLAKGKWLFPRALDEYIQYRVVLECKAFSKMESNVIGLSPPVVTELIALAKPILANRYL